MPRYIDLSHSIEEGMVTYKGLPAPIICDWMSFEKSHGKYAEGTEFSMQWISMHGNTGTYLDVPRHRYRDGHDMCGLSLERVSSVEALCVNVSAAPNRDIGLSWFEHLKVEGKAVLIRTDWSQKFGTDAYFEDHPFLSREAAAWLRDEGAALVGIDSFNIDNVDGGERPVHSILLGAEIPIVEHLTNLTELPHDGFLFSAVPPKIKEVGTFPVRAHAIMD